MGITVESLKRTAEDLGWTVTENGNEIILSISTPEVPEFKFSILKQQDIINQLYDAYMGYNAYSLACLKAVDFGVDKNTVEFNKILAETRRIDDMIEHLYASVVDNSHEKEETVKPGWNNPQKVLPPDNTEVLCYVKNSPFVHYAVLKHDKHGWWQYAVVTDGWVMIASDKVISWREIEKSE